MPSEMSQPVEQNPVEQNSFAQNTDSLLAQPAVQQLLDVVQRSLKEGSFERLVLSKYKGTESGLEKITIRQITLKQQVVCSFLYHYKTRDITKNYPFVEAVAEVKQQLSQGFKQVNLKTSRDEYQLMFSKKDKAALHQQSAAAATPLSAVNDTATGHNREKHRFVAQDRPYLYELGVTDQTGQVIPAMSRKWKQINKFVEIFDGAFAQIEQAQPEQVRVVDFGSGKGYLTFAIYDYIKQQLGKTAQVTGVELREDLVAFCNQASQKVGMTRLDFYQGDVRTFQPESVDVMIALHACDIATDYALHTGIRLNASIIMCAPCCHKQIRPQLKTPSVLKPMLQYGVHLGQEAEMLTDSLRALLLEANGYDTKVFEFVSLEHTSKNKMILAIKKPKPETRRQEILQQIEQIKQFYGVHEHCLEQLLHA